MKTKLLDAFAALAKNLRGVRRATLVMKPILYGGLALFFCFGNVNAITMYPGQSLSLNYDFSADPNGPYPAGYVSVNYSHTSNSSDVVPVSFNFFDSSNSLLGGGAGLLHTGCCQGDGLPAISFSSPTLIGTVVILIPGSVPAPGFFDIVEVSVGLGYIVPPGPTTSGYFDQRATQLVLNDTPAAVPLPAALPLFATGLGALGLLGWRRKRKAAAAWNLT
jgi:hypothetical protein